MENKSVFCEECGVELAEEDAVYMRKTGKFFCTMQCIEVHHPQMRSIIEVPQNFADRYHG